MQSSHESNDTTFLSAHIQSGLEEKIKQVCYELGAELNFSKSNGLHVQIAIAPEKVKTLKAQLSESACGQISWHT